MTQTEPVDATFMERSLGISKRPLQERYWSFIQLRNEYGKQPNKALSWWLTTEPQLNPVERRIFDHIAAADRVLDIGAGDNRLRDRFIKAGFKGDYVTVDPSHEIAHDADHIDAFSGQLFDAVVLLEVIEHIPLADFDEFMDKVLAMLRPGGALVISTPNADFISSIWAADMTHVHAYRAVDLAAYLHLRGVQSELHRVAWRSPHDRLKERVRQQVARVLTRGILQVDYARGILVLASKRA